MSSPIRIACIGCGAMANAVHYPSLISFPDAEVAAVCDLNEERMAQTCERHSLNHARRFIDYQRMVDEVEPEAVWCIGQPNIMFPLWVWLLERRCPLYIEKPMGITVHQARALAHLADKNGCVTQVSFQRRSSPILREMTIRCRERGPVTHAVCEFYKCSPAPYLDARDHMMDDGVHAIDTLRWLCRGEIVRIQSAARRIGTPDINFFSAMIEFDNGSVGMLANSWTSGRRTFRVQIHAPSICAELELETGGNLYADGRLEGESFDAATIAGDSRPWILGGFRAKIREFLDALRGGPEPSSCFADAVKTMAAADLILAQELLAG
ncbi:MAG: Gfo/Idh/MocA family oxidoreductase [Armatimonadetes bacterium]|nr:Gfo/Idh/MocA family oxidoreductase [Armatimonadota bacterium]MDE2207748.1 Gfo/Idh/MocA family oxidoreductase [Armatimonadota bacterium]